jgi:DNA-binding NarL/FixJ family response regulator
VVCAEEDTASAAVEAAVRGRPDVCLLDVNMPGDGVAAAAEIAARVPRAAIVMLTASRNDVDLFRSLEAGARGYLIRDIDPERLPITLDAVLAGEAAQPRTLVARLIDEFCNRSRRGTTAVVRRKHHDLTSREWEVLDAMREGLSTAHIARRLFVTEVTVRRHIGAILKKLQVSSRDEAVRLVARSGKLNGE